MSTAVRCAALVSATVTLLATASAPDAEAAAERDRYIILFNDSVERPREIARAQVEQRKGSLGFVYQRGPKGYSAFLSDNAVDALRNDPRVRAVRLDHLVVPASQSTPTGIARVFATANETLAINEEEDVGIDVDVAVLDTGIDYKHPDLEVVARTYCNGTVESASCTDGIGTDEVGHGTHVAGTIAARDNGEGVVGVAAGARLWSVKVLDPGAWESELTAGVQWVTKHASEIEVANMSIGCKTLPCKLPTMGEAINASAEAGVVYVVAAGNNSGDAKNSTFGTNPSVITVSALADFDGKPGGKAGSTECREFYESEWGAHKDDSLAAFSNWGSAVEVAAPGVCIRSTVPGGKYAEIGWWGTSMASPHVAGAAAILAAHSQPNSKADVEEIAKTIKNEGNFDWTDTSPDGVKEPLLDVSDESIFSPTATEKWSLQQPLNPGSGDRLLFDVACDQTATGDCTAVGRYVNAGVTTPLVQRFTKGSWSLQTAKAVGGVSVFDGVACPSESSCIAVGGYEKTAGSGVLMLAEHWNGSSWSEASTPNPKSATASFLAGVGCSSTSACTAVGYAVISGVRKPIAERWNGTTWTVDETVPVPEGATSSELYAIDCSSSTFCMAVGFYTNGSGYTRGFTAMWDGTKWSLKGIVEPKETVESALHDVSCVGSPAVCTAVGGWQPGVSNQYNLVERWKEGSWSLQTSPSNGQASVLQSVWCRTSTSCTAVGDFRSEVTSPIKTLALNWTGSEWLIEPTPNPSGAKFSALVGVSCQAPTDTCRGVGWYTDSSGTNKTLGEVRVG